MSKLLVFRIRLFLILVVLTTSAGVLDSYILNDLSQAGASALVLRSGISWAIGSLLVWGMEILFIPSRYGSWVRRLHFLTAIALKSVVTLLIVMAVSIFDSFLFEDTIEWFFVVEPEFVRIITIVFAVVILLQTSLQIVRIIGGRMLISFVLGRYLRPVRDEKIFMFLDLTDSTALAERLGDVGVQELITRFFFDIAEPIAENGGEVHRYVGDLVIVTWPLRSDEENAAAVRCCFAIEDHLRAKAGSYEAKFGVVPSFRVGLHGGPVVISQIGDQKQEISYFGDTVNTASRIERQCKALDCWLLLSGELLGRIALPETYRAQKIGSVQLRGRERQTDLFTVSRHE